MERRERGPGRWMILLAGITLLAGACSVETGATTPGDAGSIGAAPPTAESAIASPAGGAGSLATPTAAAAPTRSIAPSPTQPTSAPPRSIAPSPTPPTPASRPAPPKATRTPTPGVDEQLSEPDDGRSVTVAVGSTVTLVLHQTYWQIEGSSDPGVLQLSAGPTATAAGPAACVPGAGCGTVTAVFRAIAPGSATITAARTTCGEALRCVGSAGAFAVTIVVIR